MFRLYFQRYGMPHYQDYYNLIVAIEHACHNMEYNNTSPHKIKYMGNTIMNHDDLCTLNEWYGEYISNNEGAGENVIATKEAVRSTIDYVTADHFETDNGTLIFYKNDRPIMVYKTGEWSSCKRVKLIGEKRFAIERNI